MIELFPYVGQTVTVSEEMCDFNGHMNVNHIKKVFEQGWEFSCNDFGLDEQYFEEGFSTFTLEDCYRFRKEFLANQEIFPRFRLFNANEKLFHMLGALFDSQGNLCTTWENVEGHIDMNTRKIAPFREDKLQKIMQIKSAHDSFGAIPYELRLKIKDMT